MSNQAKRELSDPENAMIGAFAGNDFLKLAFYDLSFDQLNMNFTLGTKY